MPTSTLIVFAVAAILAVLATRRADRPHRRAFGHAVEQFVYGVPRVVLALLAAGFLAQLLPTSVIAGWLSGESGLRGIAVAIGAGLLVPGGGMLAFPLALVLAKAGAGTPQLVAFVTSWAIFAPHRSIAYELTTMGWRFADGRLLATMPMPFIAGIATALALGSSL